MSSNQARANAHTQAPEAFCSLVGKMGAGPPVFSACLTLMPLEISIAPKSEKELTTGMPGFRGIYDCFVTGWTFHSRRVPELSGEDVFCRCMSVCCSTLKSQSPEEQSKSFKDGISTGVGSNSTYLPRSTRHIRHHGISSGQMIFIQDCTRRKVPGFI